MKPIQSISEAADFLHTTVEAMYKRKKDIPHSKVGGQIYFRTEDLIDYAMSNPQTTSSHIENKANATVFKISKAK